MYPLTISKLMQFFFFFNYTSRLPYIIFASGLPIWFWLHLILFLDFGLCNSYKNVKYLFLNILNCLSTDAQYRNALLEQNKALNKCIDDFELATEAVLKSCSMIVKKLIKKRSPINCQPQGKAAPTVTRV